MPNKYWIPLLLLCIAGLIAFPVVMYQRTLDQEFWGYLPLGLFLSFWGLVVTIWLRNKAYEQRIWLTVSALAGFLFAGDFVLKPFPFFIFFAFVPILFIEYKISEAGGKKQGRKVFWYAYTAFLVWNIFSTFWVANAAIIAGIMANFVNALLMTIPIWLFHKSRKIFKPSLVYLGFVAYWLTFEYLHMRWDLTWPWLTLGNSFANAPYLIQWYEYTGVLGGSLWVLAVNLILFQLFVKERIRKEKISWPAWLRLALVVFIPVVLSLYLYYTYENKGEEKEIVIIQPNYEPHYEDDTTPKDIKLDHYLALAKETLSENTDYLLLPETVFNGVDSAILLKRDPFKKIKTFVDQYPNLKLVSGVGIIRRYLEDIPDRPTVRTYTYGEKMLYYEYFNSAIQLTNGTDEYPVYHKSKLVPGVESFPYAEALSFLSPVVDYFGGTTAGNGRQDKRDVFFDGTTGIAPIICYESVFGEYVTEYIKRGAQALFIMTNDGWWDDTPGHRQHLAFASLRAIENRRSIARAANTGISAFIDQRGRILQKTEYDKAIAISGMIPFNTSITFYVLWGDLIGRIAGFVTILLLLNLVVKRIRGPEDKRIGG